MQLNRIATIAIGSISLTAFAADPKVTSLELDHARLYLQQTQTGVIGATKGLSQAQWNFKPAADRWSIAEIVEHMVLTQELFWVRYASNSPKRRPRASAIRSRWMRS